MTALPRLYKTTKTGAIQICDISYQDDTIYVQFGQLNGKIQTKTTKCTGKNIGKKNETTPQQQAKLEARSKHNKKLKEGYALEILETPPVRLPQKVKVYQDHMDKLAFPNCYSTPKLNGVNAIYWLNSDGSLKITSRGGDEYPAIPHLEEPVKVVMKHLDVDCLNGELYIHGKHLQDIQSAVKKPKELSKELEFAIFELPTYGGVYEERRQALNTLWEALHQEVDASNWNISVLTGIPVHSHEDIEAHYNQCMASGLEGTVIYNAFAEYNFNQHSNDVFKYKKVKDGEYKIISYALDKNNHPVFQCETSEGKIFKVKPKGTDAERKLIASNFYKDYHNKWYKIEYETLSKSGIPLKPVGIALRHCDSIGNPLE